MANLMISAETLANESNGIFANAIGDCMAELHENTEVVQLADKTETTVYHATSVTGKEITLRRDSDIAYLKAGKLLASVDKESDKLKALVCAYWKNDDNWKVLTAEGEKVSFAETIEAYFPNISAKAAGIYVNVANTFLEAVYDDNGNISGVKPKSEVIPELPLSVYQPLLSVANDDTLGVAVIEKAFIDGSILKGCKGGKLTQARAKEWVSEVRPTAKRGSADGGTGKTAEGEKKEKGFTFEDIGDAYSFVTGTLSEMLETMQKHNVVMDKKFTNAVHKVLDVLQAGNCFSFAEPTAEEAETVVDGEEVEE